MPITVQELEDEIAKAFALREEYREIEDKKKKKFVELNDQQLKVIGMLEELGKTSYKSDVGTFYIKVRETFQVPKDMESKQKFFAYLKEKGIYDEMVSVHSSTLNSWATKEIEASNELDFQIPGLVKSPPTFQANMKSS